MKYIVDLNLRGINTQDYEKNPIVTRRFSDDPKDIIGKAKILKGKRQIEIETTPDFKLDLNHFTIGISTMSNYEGTYLYGLIPVPCYRDDRIIGRPTLDSIHDTLQIINKE